jgi:hypothetical protein
LDFSVHGSSLTSLVNKIHAKNHFVFLQSRDWVGYNSEWHVFVHLNSLVAIWILDLTLHKVSNWWIQTYFHLLLPLEFYLPPRAFFPLLVWKI